MRPERIISGPIGNAAGNVVRMACLFLLGRIVAQRLGGEGILALGQWQNLIGLGTALGGNALQAGFQQGMAARSDDRSWLGCGLLLGQILSFGSCIAIALAVALGGVNIPYGGSIAVAILFLACSAGTLYVNLQGIAAGLEKMGRLNAWITASGLIPLVLIAFSAKDLSSLSLALLCTPILLGPLAWLFLPHPLPSLPDRQTLSRWLPFLSIGVLPVLAGQVMQMMLRQLAIAHSSADAALWQGASRIVDTAFPVWSVAATAWILPRMSRSPQRPAWMESLGTSLAGTLPMAITLAVLAPLALRLALGTNFQAGAHILRWQCLTEIVRAMNLPMTLLLVAQGRARTFVILETGSLGLQYLLAWLLIPTLGMVALPMAGLVENLAYGTALLAVLKFGRSKA